MASFEHLYSPELISRKIWVTEKFSNLHTVKSTFLVFPHCVQVSTYQIKSVNLRNWITATRATWQNPWSFGNTGNKNGVRKSAVGSMRNVIIVRIITLIITIFGSWMFVTGSRLGQGLVPGIVGFVIITGDITFFVITFTTPKSKNWINYTFGKSTYSDKDLNMAFQIFPRLL